MKKLFVFSVLVLTVSSCASHPDVRQGLDGIHTITTHGENIKDTESNAYKQVYSFCKEQKKTVEFLSDDSFKATQSEVSLETKEGLFKKEEAAATDIKFKCVDL